MHTRQLAFAHTSRRAPHGNSASGGKGKDGSQAACFKKWKMETRAHSARTCTQCLRRVRVAWWCASFSRQKTASRAWTGSAADRPATAHRLITALCVRDAHGYWPLARQKAQGEHTSIRSRRPASHKGWWGHSRKGCPSRRTGNSSTSTPPGCRRPGQ